MSIKADFYIIYIENYNKLLINNDVKRDISYLQWNPSIMFELQGNNVMGV